MNQIDPNVRKVLRAGKNFGARHFELYRACLSNAWDLLDEAQMLVDKRSYARAYALAFTAAEEVGKALLVADWVYDLVSKQEFERAFKNHQVKLCYLGKVFSAARGEPARDANTLRRDVLRRMSSLYVGKSHTGSPEEPKNQVRKEVALEMISKVQEHLTSILSAEWLNSHLIGSKALLK